MDLSGELDPFMATAKLSDGEFVITYTTGTRNHTAALGKSKGPVIGIADANATEGQTVPVILQGISPHHSGLTVGKTYYVGDGGALVEDSPYTRIGQAISDTEILLNIQRP
jgi:hypothetical protein